MEKERKRKEYDKIYRQKNKDKIKQYLELNSEKIKEKSRIRAKRWNEKYPANKADYFKANKVGIYARRKKYRIDNPEKIKVWQNKVVDTITDSYIANQLGVLTSVLKEYPELIEAKRVQIKIKRLIKNQTA